MNGRLIIRNLIRITAIFTLCLCVLIAGCGTGREDETDEPGNDGDNIVNDTGNSGDFKITPLKFGEDPGDFWLALENKNDYPAGAYVTFVLKGSEGEVISAWDNKSRVMAPGDKDLIMGRQDSKYRDPGF